MTTSSGTPHTTAKITSMATRVSGPFHHPCGMVPPIHMPTSLSHRPIAESCCPRAWIHSGSTAMRAGHRPFMTMASNGTANAHTPTASVNRIRSPRSRCPSASLRSRSRSAVTSCSTCSAMSSRIRFRSSSSFARSVSSLVSFCLSVSSRSRMRLQRSSLSAQARSLRLVSSSSLLVSLSSKSCFLSVRFDDKSCRFVDRSS